MLLITGDVCGRYFFNSPIKGTTELARYLVPIIVFPALAWAAIEGKHIKVDFIMERFSKQVQSIFNIIMLLLCLGMYVFITWRSVIYSGQVTGIFSVYDIPQSPFYWIMTAGWVVFCLATVAQVIKNVAEAVKK